MKVQTKADNVRDIILRVLFDRGLRVDQIYSSTKDNGGNCLKASRDPLTDVLHETNSDRDSSFANLFESTEVDLEEKKLLGILDEMDLKMQYKPVRCAAHTVQLAISDGLHKYAEQIEEIRTHATAIRSRIISDRLNIQLPCPQDPTLPVGHRRPSCWMDFCASGNR